MRKLYLIRHGKPDFTGDFLLLMNRFFHLLIEGQNFHHMNQVDIMQ